MAEIISITYDTLTLRTRYAPDMRVFFCKENLYSFGYLDLHPQV